jgi:hypothetical protein
MALPAEVVARRGYLAQLLTVPPLVYPFQYNPTMVTDAKRLDWEARAPMPTLAGRGVAGLVSGVETAISTFQTGGFGKGLQQAATSSREVLGRTFSRAELKKLRNEGDRTVSIRFEIDGREARPGEPARRRNPEGHILADLAVLRSFVYPQVAGAFDLLKATFGSEPDRWKKLWFDEPPPALLVLGRTSVEGYVTNLAITETLFSPALNPVRAEVTLDLIEKIDSLSFVLDAIKRVGLAAYHTSYADIGDVLF